MNLEKLKTLGRAEILDIPLNIWGDYELLDLAEYFREEAKDEDREMAVFELILRSPLHDDEMVDYGEIYLDLINYYQGKKNFQAMLYWAAAQIAYNEQNYPDPLNLLNNWRDLAEGYLSAGEVDSGLGIFTRLITRFPGDVWNYNILGLALPDIGLNRLAVETLDRGLALTTKKDPEQLHKQFQDLRQKAQANLDKGQDLTGQVAEETLKNFRAALSLTGEQSPDNKAPLAHLSPLDRLISLDRQGDQLVDEEILKQGRVLIPELIHLGMDEELMKHSLGPWHAARLLNELRSGAAPELEALANWLDRTSAEDWQPWLSAKKFGKIGGYTVEELGSLMRDPRNGSIIREAALSELEKRASQRPQLRLEFIRLLRELLNRENADQASEESFTAFLIGSAVELKAKELLPDIQRAFAEDRVDPQIIDEAFAYEKLGAPAPPKPPRRTDGLYLRLKCAACGRIREHFTRFVILDQTTLGSKDPSRRSPYILDHEIVCPKCGAVEQYHMPSFEAVKLMQLDSGQITSMMLNQKKARPPRTNQYAYFVRSEAFGRPMHPLDTIDEYRRRIALDPQNAELYMRLGNSFRFIGRFEQALEAYRKAVDLAPDDPEIVFPAASAEHDFGDPAAARKLYERCIGQGKGLRDLFQGGLNENVLAAMNGLRALDKGEMSPWLYQLKNADGQTLLPPQWQQAGQPAKKDKRKRHKK